MGKVIFIDVDGTLVNYENHLPASAVQAIRAARANGHRVYISTGRSRAEIYPELWAIGLDGMIGGNGSYVEDQGQVILHQTMTSRQCRDAVDWLLQRGLEFYLECNSGLFASPRFETAGEPVIRRYASGKGSPDASALTVREAFPDMIFGAPLCRGDVNKISYILSSYQDFLDARSAFPDLKHGTWGGQGEQALFGDMGVSRVSKARAIQMLLDHLHVSQADTIAFGDAKIDIPMLQYCAVGVAMGNGGAEIRAMADLVTDSVDEDGLLHAFQKLGLFAPQEANLL